MAIMQLARQISLASAPRALRPLASLQPIFLRGRSSLAGQTNVIEVTDQKHYEEEIGSATGLSVVDFTAKWCGPCRAVAPVYDALSVEHPQVKFLKVDIDNEELQEVVGSAKVSAVPTFNFVKSGEILAQIQGADQAQLIANISKFQ
ncbi:hypothetical protein CYMTET_30196 [Cymbomonas tetramitiformis]|uniref:Thioredoxin domain-containing protein n=1 Tax=Cymbomonas tetramitiformis TaxID=36881 RepID=A0AAE0FKW1_9CHLO|nr:hypothetical protein CYMTET_30196 [Cymbomonas tetramitiformis]